MKHTLAAVAFSTFAGIFAGIFVNQASGAGDVPVLAELFTSEGCSSCPPADALLMKLDRLQPVTGAHVIVLSEHVDYWDQLGWRDSFSSPQFTKRQADYARLMGSEVYTPQLIIDGRVQLNGSDAKDIQAAIAHAAARPKLPVRIVQATREATREGDNAVVHLSVPALPSGRSDVWVAVADESDQSSVTKGENSGRRLAHVAVVRSLTKVGSVSKTEGFDQTVRLPLTPANTSGSRIVVFVAQSHSSIMGADSMPLAEGSVIPRD
jgi:hypothetical protein